MLVICFGCWGGSLLQTATAAFRLSTFAIWNLFLLFPIVEKKFDEINCVYVYIVAKKKTSFTFIYF
ncbi:hypothetical protein Syun_001920 [Stephania yunnanensis]|uniref:Uncharacterized protein n=1 Tax=Stephania yunnanensis TaxID=152371 RepID=A0AAP0Q6Y6_9MAGN